MENGVYIIGRGSVKMREASKRLLARPCSLRMLIQA